MWIRANQTEERFDKEVQIEMAYEMEHIMLEDLPIIPVMENPNRYLKAERVQLPTPDNSYICLLYTSRSSIVRYCSRYSSTSLARRAPAGVRDTDWWSR